MLSGLSTNHILSIREHNQEMSQPIADPRHHKEVTQNTDSHIHVTIKVKQPTLFLSKMIAELEMASRTNLEKRRRNQ